jgi:hypothetical protein
MYGCSMNTTAKGLGHGTTLGPPEEFLPGWRAACLAYRREWRKGHSNGGAMWREAIAAYMNAVPGSTREEADQQAGDAVHWASVYYNEWLYSRTQPG